jgi:hypothetical protein
VLVFPFFLFLSLVLSQFITGITSTVGLTPEPMITTPEDWARFHHPTTGAQRIGNAPTAHPSCYPMSMFADHKRTTARMPAYVELIEDHPMSENGSMSGLLRAFTNAVVSGYETAVGVPDDTPSLPPISFPVALSHHSLQSMCSRDTLRPPTEYSQDRFQLVDEDEGDDKKTIGDDHFDDEPTSEHWGASRSENMSLCSIPGSLGD